MDMNDDASTILLVAFRHANRNPSHFLDTISKLTWGSDGELSLNELGREQARSLGDCINRYLINYGEINEMELYSSSAERCLETIEIVKSRLRHGKEKIKIDDKMLRMYAVDDPRNEEAWKPVSSDIDDDLLPEIQDDLFRKRSFIDYLRKNTGWPMTVSDLGDLADNIDQMNKFHENLPQWVENPDLTGYDKYRMIAEVDTFKEYSQVWGSRYIPCRDLMSGNWLNHIAERIETAKVNHNNGSRMNTLAMFATHTEVILSTMRRMGIQIERIEASGGFIAEIRISEQEGERVRIFELVPEGDGHTICKANILNNSQCENEWMSVENWLDGINDNENNNQ